MPILLTSKAPGQDGKSHHGTLLEERILPVTGGIVGSSVDDMYEKRQELSSIFNPKISGKLTYINNAGSHTIECVVEDSPAFKNKVSNIQEFLVQLYCPQPFWMDIQESKEEIALWVGDFHFHLIIPSGGIIMSHRVSNLIVNANNKGDVDCGIVHGTVDQVDTTAIFNQFQSWYSQTKETYDKDIGVWTTEKKQVFDAWYLQNTKAFLDKMNIWYDTNNNEFVNWFNGIKNVLDGNTAGNLLNKINEVNDNIPKVFEGKEESLEIRTGDFWLREVT